MYLLLFVGVLCWSFIREALLSVLSSFCDPIDEEEKFGCFSFIVFWTRCYCKWYVAFPHGFMVVLFVDRFHFVFVFAILFCRCHAAFWSPAGKGVTPSLYCLWYFLLHLSFSHTVSWVRCGTWLYRFLIFAFFQALVCSVIVCYFLVTITYFLYDFYMFLFDGTLRNLKE